MEDKNIWHITPTNDLENHLEETEPGHQFVLEGEVRTTFYCMCKCSPVVQYEEGGAVIVIHNSFDGREHYEKDNKVRKN